MSEYKRFTAQEMREMANAVDDVSINYNGEYYYEKDDKFNPDLVRDMLRQAAEDKDAKDAEIAELRECLREAVREKCPFTRMSCKHGEPCDYECGTFKWRKALQDEGGAK